MIIIRGGVKFNTKEIDDDECDDGCEYETYETHDNFIRIELFHEVA